MSDKIDIEHLAKLSRLELTDVEKEKYAEQMGGVLEYVEKLSEFRNPGRSRRMESPELNEGLLREVQPGNSDQKIEAEESSSTTSGESFATPEEILSLEVGIINGVTDVMREDEVAESLPREEALKNAPAQKDGFIQVKAVFA